MLLKLYCLLFGHDWMLQRQRQTQSKAARIFLQCQNCGRETKGF
jgi:hypothetical protein